METNDRKAMKLRQLEETITELDDVDTLAMTQMAKCIIAGGSPHMAITACNEVLAAHGREPLPHPLAADN